MERSRGKSRRYAAWVACRQSAQPRVGMGALVAASMLSATLRVVRACHPQAPYASPVRSSPSIVGSDLGTDRPARRRNAARIA